MTQENMDPSFVGEGIYKENILDHYKNPHNKGEIENAEIKFTENNPLCGDIITVNLKLNDQKVEDIKFEGKGCAISIASASLLTDKVKGMTIDEVMKLTKDEILEMLMIPIGPVRLKCALLCLETLQKAVI